MNITYKENELITFFDQIGHVIVAEYLAQDETHIKVKNPMYLAVVPQQSKEHPGQIEFHFETPAWLFRDFMADHNAPLVINLRKDTYSFAESFTLASIVRLRYFNNFSRIVGGAPIPVDANGKPIDPALLKRQAERRAEAEHRCEDQECECREADPKEPADTAAPEETPSQPPVEAQEMVPDDATPADK